MISFPSKSVYTLYNPVESSVMRSMMKKKDYEFEKMDEMRG